ncbi:MAG: glutathione S-transferase family protein [Myxococcales bacterium]|nr:glutathione S-transferase family protein [Myxococcales bacterium]
MSEVKVFGVPQSSYTWSARLALTEKGVEHELVISPPRSEQQSARHPFGKVPALVHGEHTIFETVAIIRYVDEAFDGPALQPATPLGRARMHQWMGINDSYLYPSAIFGVVLPRLVFGPQGAPIDEGAIKAAVPKARQALKVLNDGLDGQTWFGGDTFSLADITLGPVLFYCGFVPEGPEMFAGFGNLERWKGRWLERPAVQATMPPRG